MRATGANFTAVVETQYQQTYTSNVIAPETTSSPGYTSAIYPLSPTDAAVVSAIKAAQAQGLTVSLKPQVDSLDGVFRGTFAPTNPTAWFASYQTFILHYAQLASQNNVGFLVIGTELKSLTTATYKSNWETIISAIRTQYPGLTLIYGANATGAGDEFTSVSFWGDVDIIGVDGYFPLTNQNDPSLAALIAAWTNNKSGFNIVAALKNLQSTYNKPLIFSEIGYVSVSGTNQQPYASITGTYDTTEQQNCYEAFFQVFSPQSAWMKGVFWWDWTVSPPARMTWATRRRTSPPVHCDAAQVLRHRRPPALPSRRRRRPSRWARGSAPPMSSPSPIRVASREPSRSPSPACPPALPAPSPRAASPARRS